MLKRISKNSLRLFLVFPIIAVITVMPLLTNTTVKADMPTCYTILTNTNFTMVDEQNWYINKEKTASFVIKMYSYGLKVNTAMPARVRTDYFRLPFNIKDTKDNMPQDIAPVTTIYTESKFVGSQGSNVMVVNVPTKKGFYAITSVDAIRLNGEGATSCYVNDYSNGLGLPSTISSFWKTPAK